MGLVLIAEAVEDGDGVLHRGLIDGDRREAALESGILFDELAVLVEGGRADGLELPAGEHGLQDVGGVHAAFRRGTGAHDHVDLVDEEDDILVAHDRVDDLFEALLKVAAVARARHKGGDAERIHLLIAQELGHFALRDRKGEPLDDGALAHARLADEHGIVLGAAGEDLHDLLDLVAPADDGVELAQARLPREVLAVSGEGGHQPVALLFLLVRLLLKEHGGREGLLLAVHLAELLRLLLRLAALLPGGENELLDAEREIVKIDVHPP